MSISKIEKTKLTKEENDLIKKFNYHQNSGFYIPFRCANNSRHGELRLVFFEKEPIELQCPDCDYIQKNMPPMPI